MSTVATDRKVTVDLNEKGDRIWVTFDYDPALVRKVKSIVGKQFMPREKGGPAWQFPLEITVAQRLREQFADALVITPRCREWASKEVGQQNKLRSLSMADDAKLEVLPEVLPELFEFMRPYQKADAAFMSATSCINANQPGMGKTIEAIAAVFERGNDEGQHIVIAPKTSLTNVWQKELERWQEYPVLILSGDYSPEERQDTLDVVKDLVDEDLPFWLVLNPAFMRMYRDKEAEKVLVKGKWEYPLKPAYPELLEVEWTTRIIDEFHLMGLGNTATGFYKCVEQMKVDHSMLLSGTPVSGKPIKLFGALHTIAPEKYPSKWRWVDQWLVSEDNGYGRVVSGIQYGREDAFWEHLRPLLVRRTKAEVVKELPEKNRIDIWCDMSEKQRKQYMSFAANAEIKIEEENLSATSVLAEYTRLKQFADAHQKVKHMADGSLQVLPTTNSGKLDQTMELLAEWGIDENEMEEGVEPVVIGSQFSAIVDMITDYLNEKGIKAVKITGAISQAKREEYVKGFQSGEYKVLVISTKAGGVSITLDRASRLIIWDETWTPDDQEQLEDRVHRISRIHQVDIYYLRSKGTIEEYIQEVVLDKDQINKEILDLRRMGLRAVK